MKKIDFPIRLILGFAVIGLIAQAPSKKIYKGCYFGQNPPGNSPEVFLPEVFNQFVYLHGKLVFAPNGREVCWDITTVDKGADMNMRWFIKQKNDGTWSAPVESFLLKDRKENGPCYSRDGHRLYFQSRSPLNGKGENKDIDIWYRQRISDGWGEPINLGEPVNSSGDDSQPWVMGDGSIIFCRSNEKSPEGDKGGSDIYYAQFKDGNYSEPACFGPEINSAFHDTEPTMSPDGSYMLFISNRPGGYSRMMNLYVSFRTPADGWTEAECLSFDFKIENIWFPTISYDGKYLFFCGGYPTEHGYNKSNYYWLSTNVINNMNPFKKNAKSEQDEGIDEFIKIIDDHYVADAIYKVDDGFSCIISINSEMILFDTGCNRNVFMQNLKTSGIDPKKINNIFISHNHSDHIGGLVDFLGINPDAEVFMSDEMPANAVGQAVSVFERTIGATKDNVVRLKNNEATYRILPDVYSTGFLTGYLGTKRIPIKEQSLVLDTDQGLIIVVGCSHPELTEIVRRAKEISDKPIHMLLGGFHLDRNDMTKEKIVSIIMDLKELGVQKCGPTHCSGELAVRLFKQYYGENFIALGAGKKITLN